MPSIIQSPIDPEAAGRRYTRIADAFAAARSPARGIGHLEQALRLCSRRERALDAGCGAGRPLTRRLVDEGFQVTGIDLSAGLLELARTAVPEARLLRADIRVFDEGARYDLIVAWDSLFHLPYGDQRQGLGQLLHLLDDGGVILFTVGGLDDERTGTMHGERFYYSSLARAVYREILAEAGLELVTDEDDQAPTPHVVLIARRPATGGPRRRHTD